MPTRITLRLMGAANGKKASLPIGATMADLLALATTKLALPQPAKRVFDASGDELDDDEDGARYSSYPYLGFLDHPNGFISRAEA